MRIKTSFILVFIVFILAAGAVFAETPNEQFKQMVAQLQKNPGDNALREMIIKLAQELKPAPAVPEEAERRMARGMAAFKGAKSVADYRDAAKEFEQATLAAPWYGNAYVNLGVAQDKAENYEAALRSLKLALLALPNDKEIKVLIYEVEYRNDKVNSAVAAVEQEKKTNAVRAAREREQQDAYLRSIDGARFVSWSKFPEYTLKTVFEVRGRVLIQTTYLTEIHRKKTYPLGMSQPGQSVTEPPYEFRDGYFLYSECGDNSVCAKYTISPDRQQLIRSNLFLKGGKVTGESTKNVEATRE